MESDYLKLSEQYAAFLVAVGGVSITVLALVLSFGPTPVETDSESESRDRELRAFLVAALVVATVSCFIGSQMMAETAAFITYHHQTWTGERLFLLASANIFIAIALVLFALVLLLTTSGKVDVSIIKPLAGWVFVLVLVGAIIWVIFAAKYRMPPPGGCLFGVIPALVSLGWGVFLCCTKACRKHLLSLSLIPVVVSTVFLLLYFVTIYGVGDRVSNGDIIIFSATVSLSYVCLLVAGVRAMFFDTLPKNDEGKVTVDESVAEPVANPSAGKTDTPKG